MESYDRLADRTKASSKAIKRIDLFNYGILFFTKDNWIGLKAPKDADYHFHTGFTLAGLSILKTKERPRKSHTSLAKVTTKELQKGLGKFISEVLSNEIDNFLRHEWFLHAYDRVSRNPT